jgi:hypothetical protein
MKRATNEDLLLIGALVVFAAVSVLLLWMFFWMLF